MKRIYYFGFIGGLSSIIGSLCLSLITFWLILTKGYARFEEPNISFAIFEFCLLIFGLITLTQLITLVIKNKIL